MSGPQGTLVAQVANEIRQAVLTGALVPGQKIAQNDLAAKYGTSRLPVREALRLLENEGLVAVRPNAGARVAPLTMAELTEVYLMRERLEPLALAESIRHLTTVDVGDIRERFEEMDVLATQGDRDAWLETDRQFHLAGLSAAPMPRLMDVISGLWNIATRYRRAYASLWFETDMAIQRAEHLLLLTAIERKLSNEAEIVLAAHIRRTRLSLLGHQGLFDDSPVSR